MDIASNITSSNWCTTPLTSSASSITINSGGLASAVSDSSWPLDGNINWTPYLTILKKYENILMDKIRELCKFEDIDGGCKIIFKSDPSKVYYLYENGDSCRETDDNSIEEFLELVLGSEEKKE